MTIFNRTRNFLAQNNLFVILTVLFFSAALYISTVRYRTYLDGFDYSVFTQTIWQYANFRLPHSTIRDVNLILGDHFHPLLVVLAPLFWAWSNPTVLVVVQPFFFTLSAIPLYLLAKKYFGRNNALLISAAYLISHGIQYALFFDFHEIALAVPLLSWLIYSIDTKNYRHFIVAAALLCLLKEELILLVIAAGVVLAIKTKRYMLGGLTSLAALVFFIILTRLLMPLLAGHDKYYSYWTYDSFGTDPANAIKNAVSRPFGFIRTAFHSIFNNPVKIETLRVLIISSALSVFFSWYALLALPDLALRLLSDRGTFYWSFWFHYGAILMPIIFFCFIDVVRKVRARASDRYAGKLVATLCVAILVCNVVYMFNKRFPFSQMFNPQFYSLNTSVQAGEGEAKRRLGPHSSVTAPVVIAAHFANRDKIYILTDNGRWHTDENVLKTQKPNTDFVILNEKLPITDVAPWLTYRDLRKQIEEAGYTLDYHNPATGWVIYRHSR